jgi:chemotaxis protein methyltransferase CheR
MWTDPAFEALARLIGLRTGMAFPDDRHPRVEMGIRRAMERAGAHDLGRYRERIGRDDVLFDELVGELTIGETYFFREPAHFQFLRGAVLPALRERWGGAHVVRAWSAGCSTGEEPYSLAMVFDEEGLADRAHVLATDVAPAALAKARRATYGDWSLRGEGASAALPHLERLGNGYVVRDPIRRRVLFEPLNLALDVYPSMANGTWGLDLILCRNVLIYFDRKTIRAVAARLHAALGDGGWLMTASSDPPLSDEAPFETVVTDRGIFYRKAVPLPPAFHDSPVVDLRVDAAAASAQSEPVRRDRSSTARRSDRVDAEGTVPRSALVEALGTARDDLSRGRYAEAAGRMSPFGEDAEAVALRIRALANVDPAEAERACAEAVGRHSTVPELHYLHAVLLHTLGRDEDAACATRRVLFLDRTLAIAHFLHGTILRRRGDRARAWRAFRNARDLCGACPGAEIVPLSDGEPAGRLGESAALQMAQLEPAGDRP